MKLAGEMRLWQQLCILLRVLTIKDACSASLVCGHRVNLNQYKLESSVFLISTP